MAKGFLFVDPGRSCLFRRTEDGREIWEWSCKSV